LEPKRGIDKSKTARLLFIPQGEKAAGTKSKKPAGMPFVPRGKPAVQKKAQRLCDETARSFFSTDLMLAGSKSISKSNTP
jgi:hypothetical protein